MHVVRELTDTAPPQNTNDDCCSVAIRLVAAQDACHIRAAFSYGHCHHPYAAFCVGAAYGSPSRTHSPAICFSVSGRYMRSIASTSERPVTCLGSLRRGLLGCMAALRGGVV